VKHGWRFAQKLIDRGKERLGGISKQGDRCLRHIRRIVVWEKPVSAAIERIDQCVASAGVVRNVCSITAAT
jgi:hypothetical protein